MSLSGTKVCVIGGAGFIGSNLCEALASGGAKLRIVDDYSTGKRENLSRLAKSANVEVVEADITDQAACQRIVAGIQVVFDLACLGVRHSIGKPERNFAVNGNGTLNLLMAARKAKVERFVYVSSSEVYGSALRIPMDELHPTYPTTVYGAGKLAGEALARAFHLTYKMATMVVRPFNTYGPNSHHEGDSGEVIPKFLVRAMNGLPPIIFGDPTNARDFTYVTDTVRGILDAASCDSMIGETLNIAYGKPATVGEVAEVVLRVTGRGDLRPVMERPRPGDIHLLYADTTRAQKLIRWKPSVALEEGIGALLAHLKKSGADFKKMLSEDSVVNWQE